MKELYKDNKAYERVGNKLSEVICPTNGLRAVSYTHLDVYKRQN